GLSSLNVTSVRSVYTYWRWSGVVSGGAFAIAGLSSSVLGSTYMSDGKIQPRMLDAMLSFEVSGFRFSGSESAWNTSQSPRTAVSFAGAVPGEGVACGCCALASACFSLGPPQAKTETTNASLTQRDRPISSPRK